MRWPFPARITALAGVGLSDSVTAYGGVNPLSFGGEYVMLDLRLSTLPSFTIGETTISSPSENAEQSLNLLLQQAQAAAGETKLIGWLNGGDETQLQLQKDILQTFGINGVVVSAVSQ